MFSFKKFIEEKTIKPQDSDVKSLPGSQPKGYYKGVAKDKKDDRAKQFVKQTKMSDDNPAAYKKHVESNADAEVWFHHGILDAASKSHVADPNYPGYQFEEMFAKQYGVAPSGEFYDAYKLVKSFRDGMQKALWVRKDNPNAAFLQAALVAMTQNTKARQAIEAKVGVYDWKIGSDGNNHRDVLMTFITEPALRNLVKFNTEALGLKSVYKSNLVK